MLADGGAHTVYEVPLLLYVARRPVRCGFGCKHVDPHHGRPRGWLQRPHNGRSRPALCRRPQQGVRLGRVILPALTCQAHDHLRLLKHRVPALLPACSCRHAGCKHHGHLLHINMGAGGHKHCNRLPHALCLPELPDLPRQGVRPRGPVPSEGPLRAARRHVQHQVGATDDHQFRLGRMRCEHGDLGEGVKHNHSCLHCDGGG